MVGDIRAHFVTTQLENTLTAYVRRMNSMPLDILSDALIAAIDDLIRSEGNGEWPELADSTIRRHPRRRGGMLLQDTGLLANIQHVAGSPGTDWVEVGSPAPYAIYHSSRRARRIIPLRDFLDIDMLTVLDDISDSILREID